MKNKDLLGIVDGDLIEIDEGFIQLTNCKYALVVRAWWTNPAPSTHLKRTMLEILKPNSDIQRIPLSFVKKVYKKNEQS